MEGPLQPQTPQPPKICSSPGPAGKSCWNLDVKVVVVLVTLAGAVILLLLCRLLQLRHRLRLARAMHPLEYHSFYHTATYTLKHPAPCQDLPAKNGTVPEATPPLTTVTPIAITPLPPPLVLSPPPLPPPLVLSPPPLPPPPVLSPPPLPLPPSLVLPPPPSPFLALPLPLPVIHPTPPSPHLSWGACSDADVYSRIGVFRPSRLSNPSKVILFEHSSL